LGVKVRADQLVVARGLAESRTRAQALILAGNVFVGERRVGKAGDLLAEDAELSVKGRDHPWVSRGGIKLDHGLAHFGFDVTGAVALDVGSSTGGFTDVLLNRGAAKVYAVDVGTNQLAWKLRSDPRVIVHEQTNARDLTTDIIPEAVDIVVCDASFIGLAKVLDAALGLARPGASLAGVWCRMSVFSASLRKLSVASLSNIGMRSSAVMLVPGRSSIPDPGASVPKVN